MPNANVPDADRDAAAGLQRYVVGGSVRDRLLGLPVQDVDWVVLGATPEQMVAAGFRPVGRDFPVFLHPQTHEEHALARTERKTAPGYRGFVVHCAPDVTLDEDLGRRDLTINAMAMRDDGTLIDPHGGQQDLADGWLRHVGPAFGEDPVRILRLARFAARFDGFRVAPETRTLMQAMVTGGEVDALVAERVWQELAKGLMEPHPARMFEVLQDCGALAVLLPELPRTPEAMAALGERLQRCTQREQDLPVRYATLVSTLEADRVTRVGLRLRVPLRCREIAEEFVRQRTLLLPLLDSGTALHPLALLDTLDRCDAWRRGSRLLPLLQTAAATLPDAPQLTRRIQTLVDARDDAALLDQGAIARQYPGSIERMKHAIHDARLQRLARFLDAADSLP